MYRPWILRFSKLPTTIDQQLALLEDRGMELGCKETAKQWLESVGYYRLSAYWLRFEAPPTNGAVRSKIFQHGSKFEAVTLAPTQWFLPEPKRIRGG